MKINSFAAEGVHGYLKFDINFYPDLTFLIGINGSGKTSALKLILGLTTPIYQYLTQISYTYCEVTCSSTDSERDIQITSKQNLDSTFTLTLTLQNQHFRVQSEPIRRFNRTDETAYDAEEINLIEQRHRENFETLEVTRRIRELATPTFLGLDRRIYEGKNIEYRLKRRGTVQSMHPKYRRRPFDSYFESQAIDSSLGEVQLLVFDYIRKIAQQQSQLSDDFKHRIFSQSFAFVEDVFTEEIPSPSEIAERKREVLAAIDSLEITYLNVAVEIFFDKIFDISSKNAKISKTQKKLSTNQYSRDYLDILIKWNYNGSQLKRINSLISYSQQYQKEIAELRDPLKRLETIASNFLKEGKKQLSVAPDGEIKVNLKNGNSTNIHELSSGEKQIITMIAHLIFEEDQKPSGIFIIDEPEISLHIAWQEIFVRSIMEASPKTQFILATHSPSIIARVDQEKYCQDLNKLNF